MSEIRLPVTYRISNSRLIVGFWLIALMGGLEAWIHHFFMAGVILWLFLGFFWVAALFAKVTLTEQGIRLDQYFDTWQLGWADMGKVEKTRSLPIGYNRFFSFYGMHGEKCMKVSFNLIGSEHWREFVTILKRKAPQAELSPEVLSFLEDRDEKEKKGSG